MVVLLIACLALIYAQLFYTGTDRYSLNHMVAFCSDLNPECLHVENTQPTLSEHSSPSFIASHWSRILVYGKTTRLNIRY